MTRDEMIAKAEADGIDIDKRWTDEKIEEALTAPAKPKKAKTMPVLLHYGYWHGEVKHAANSVVDLPIADAKAIIGTGKAERADPMPEE